MSEEHHSLKAIVLGILVYAVFLGIISIIFKLVGVPTNEYLVWGLVVGGLVVVLFGFAYFLLAITFEWLKSKMGNSQK